MKHSGSEILIKSLLEEKVEAIFGYPGGQVIDIYDALYDAPIKHYLVRHEQAAAHAAEGYARATGKPGVCIATSGPGATNLVTGLADAYIDSVPMVAITGQVPCSMLGKDTFQEADIFGITLPVTKHSFLVKDVKDLSRTIKEAFYIATTGRPGPVLIDLPKDVSQKSTEFQYPQEVNLRGYKPDIKADMSSIEEAAGAIMEAKRPVIMAGGGIIISGAHEELKQLAEQTLIPVATTLMGKGSFPENHPLSLGLPGMHGTKYANYAISESDLLIVIGARFSDRVTGRIDTFAPNARIIHIDIDPAEIGKNVDVDIPVVGDVKEVVKLLAGKLQKSEPGDWQKKIAQMKEQHPLGYEADGKLKPQYIIEEISSITKGEAVITTEVGQHQMWAAQYYKTTQPRSFISSGGLGTMGFGFPAAIGAQVGRPNTPVFDIAGDGSIQMNIQELATAVEYKLPVKIVILNNHYLGMVRQWQELFYNHRYSNTDISGPDFVKVAEAYGAAGIRVQEPGEVRKALEKAMEINDRPVILDFIVEREENVYPMVPPGGAINKMIGG